MTSTDLQLQRIRQIAINVHELDRAVAFYRDTLGLRLLFQAPPGLAFFECGGVRLMLSRAEAEEFDHPASVLYYGVEDVAAARDALVARGVRFESEPHVVHRTDTYELRIGFFRDSEGNLLGIMGETGTL